MSTDGAIARMAQVARCAELRRLCGQLEEAVAAADFPRAASLDHSVRNAVMAMVGEGAPSGPDADNELSALESALASLRSAVSRIRAEKSRELRESGARKLYLAPKPHRPRP